jgi:hypothetical protein
MGLQQGHAFVEQTLCLSRIREAATLRQVLERPDPKAVLAKENYPIKLLEPLGYLLTQSYISTFPGPAGILLKPTELLSLRGLSVLLGDTLRLELDLIKSLQLTW